MRHLFQAHTFVDLALGQVAELERCLAKTYPLVLSRMCDLPSLVVADLRAERGHEHERILHILLGALGIQFHPATQWSVKELHASASSPTECRTVWIITGCKAFSSRFRCEPADCMRFTLPGMIDGPGPRSRAESLRAQPRSEPSARGGTRQQDPCAFASTPHDRRPRIAGRQTRWPDMPLARPCLSIRRRCRAA